MSCNGEGKIKVAQRTIHYLFAEIISQQVDLKNKNRFLLGSVLPDAYCDVKDRDVTHFMVREEHGKYVDFQAFLERYYDQIQKDDLYLGYYIHLVEDAFYRNLFHNKYRKTPHSMEEVKRLHTDYHILNAYIVKKYGLQNELDTTDDLPEEIFHEIADFRVKEFLAEMAEDFREDIAGETYYITEKMVDEFVEDYLSLALQEIESVKEGKSCLKVEDFVWGRKR